MGRCTWGPRMGWACLVFWRCTAAGIDRGALTTLLPRMSGRKCPAPFCRGRKSEEASYGPLKTLNGEGPFLESGYVRRHQHCTGLPGDFCALVDSAATNQLSLLDLSVAGGCKEWRAQGSERSAEIAQNAREYFICSARDSPSAVGRNGG